MWRRHPRKPCWDDCGAGASACQPLARFVARALLRAASPLLGTLGEPRTIPRRASRTGFHSNLCPAAGLSNTLESHPQSLPADVAQALVLAASPLLGTHGEVCTGGRFHSNLCPAPAPSNTRVCRADTHVGAWRNRAPAGAFTPSLRRPAVLPPRSRPRRRRAGGLQRRQPAALESAC